MSSTKRADGSLCWRRGAGAPAAELTVNAPHRPAGLASAPWTSRCAEMGLPLQTSRSCATARTVGFWFTHASYRRRQPWQNVAMETTSICSSKAICQARALPAPKEQRHTPTRGQTRLSPPVNLPLKGGLSHPKQRRRRERMVPQRSSAHPPHPANLVYACACVSKRAFSRGRARGSGHPAVGSYHRAR